MIKKIINFFKAINEWGDYTQRKFVENATQLCYWPQFFMLIAFAGIPWLFAWNAHHISIWLDITFGLGPHDIDSAGKVAWRRTWSTALCAPVIVYTVCKFTYNRFQYRDYIKKSKS